MPTAKIGLEYHIASNYGQSRINAGSYLVAWMGIARCFVT